MVYFTYNPNEHHQQFLFKSDTSTQELDRFFSKNAGVGIIPTYTQDRRKSRSANEKFGIYRILHDSVSHGKILTLEKSFKEELQYLEFDKWCEMAITTQQRHLDSYTVSNEIKLRELSQNYLNEQYNIKFMQEEYTHISLPVRADLFAVDMSKKVISLEIKSDKDTFVRLEKQLSEYLKFSHVVYLVIDITHLAKFLKRFNTYAYDAVGVLVYENNELLVYKEPYVSKSIFATNLLWKDEYFQLLNVFRTKKSMSRFSADKIIGMCHEIYSVAEWHRLCEILFVNRYLCDSDIKIIEHIDDLDYKQNKFEKLLEPKREKTLFDNE